MALYNIKKHLPEVQHLRAPVAHVENLDFLFSHRNIKTKWKVVPSDVCDGYHLLSVQVVATKKFLGDDEVYKNEPRLQQLVPRGLCYVLKRDEDPSILHLAAIVYPTSKFFGDDDQSDGVVVLGDDELQKDVPKGCRMIGTEKANGEMFTVNAVHKGDDGSFHVVLGSKNNKFLFPFHPQKTTKEEIRRMIKSYLDVTSPDNKYPNVDLSTDKRWTYDNVWVEMSEYFLGKMLEISDGSTTLCDRLFTEKLTACGEFESWLHPHVVELPEGHRSVSFFAFTTYDEGGSPKSVSGAERLNQLDWVDSTGFQTVTRKEVAAGTDIMQLRRDVWARKNSEGLVLLVLDAASGEIQRMVKMKTIWYVVHRGYRERLRRFVTGRNAKTTGQARYELMEKELRSVLESKLSIFKASLDEKWKGSVPRLVEAVRKVEKEKRMKEVFSFEYPLLIRAADGQE
ncbi:hypothetical protein PROFUN_04454 [Planoprotostelium fungivorum]|uniref:T4 RNA ligase 1-like N-terminal domain-containing protein n=1 Tax=Planoprotostelium fungivorum TaxID=1890364 RepID=A0A2P6NVS3_9EUKA|nr:hypothetical protein PROFUN_04454 [Planoprotostelium fungivorum]